MEQAVCPSETILESGISMTTQVFYLGETSIKGVDLGVSVRFHGDWASKCVAASR